MIQGYGEAPAFDLPPEIMENFRRFDVDGNNFLDPYEFASVLQELHNFTEPYIPLVKITSCGCHTIYYIFYYTTGSVFI